MKTKYLSALALPLICTSLTYTEQQVAPFFSTRSISRNAARDLAGWTNYINEDSSREIVYGAMSITPEYSHTFNGSRITNTLFGDNLSNSGKCPSLKISGSQVNNRNPQDLLADYFYLPTDFESVVHFKPTIDNLIIDFGLYMGLDAWKKGMYLWIHAPFNHTRWDLNITEDISESGSNDSAQGYYTPNSIPRNKLLDGFANYANGQTMSDIDNVTFQELQFSKMTYDRLVRSRMAEIRTALGWNFYAKKDYHAGFNAQIAWPTGLRPKGEYLFEPIVGNGHFWELGLGVSGHYTFWRNEDETSHASFYADFNVTHLFRTRQARVFDLKRNGTLSRYMLAMIMDSPASDLQGSNTIPSAQFNNDLLPVANFTTLDVDVSIAAQADIVFMLNSTLKNWSFDLGYNFWGRSSENITLRAVESFAETTYALKGDSHTFGFSPTSTTAVALSATQDKATIHTGNNMPTTDSTDIAVITAAAKNPNIDYPQAARTNPTAPAVAQNLLYAQNLADTSANYINTSVPAIFVTRNDLNIDGAQTRGSSSKIFAHASYTWNDKMEWQPYLGFGGEVEWGHHSKRSCDKTPLTLSMSKRTPQCSTSQWGVWVKTGATFN